MAQQTSSPYGHAGSDPNPYPPMGQSGNAPFSDKPPSYNPSYAQNQGQPYNSQQVVSPPANYVPQPPQIYASQPGFTYAQQLPLNYNNMQYTPYQNASPSVAYSGVPQQQLNIAAINSVPGTNQFWRTNGGPGWYPYNSNSRKKVFLIFGIFAGIMMAVFIIIFVTMSVKAQQEHEEFRKMHFGN